MILNGCYSTPPEPKVITITKPAPILPPLYLLNDCALSQSPINTNRELLTFAVKTHNQNVLCNLDKAALRQWRAKYE
ncbi:Rz1-like lysis system protein LysC [Pseudoalteromonas rhizosphaerae]|uniref:Rz1-like lysis system protein LysC n=1 Tax=Pseudoalteromonas rhizosphaerae TaxID=2518973 RepID=UPI00384D0430